MSIKFNNSSVETVVLNGGVAIVDDEAFYYGFDGQKEMDAKGQLLLKNSSDGKDAIFSSSLGLTFNGDLEQYIETTFTPSTNLPWTIVAIFDTSDNGRNEAIFGSKKFDHTKHFTLEKKTGIGISLTVGVTSFTIPFGTDIERIMFTLNPANKDMKAYRNRVLSNEKLSSGYDSSVSGYNTIIGAENQHGAIGLYYSGNIQAVYIIPELLADSDFDTHDLLYKDENGVLKSDVISEVGMNRLRGNIGIAFIFTENDTTLGYVKDYTKLNTGDTLPIPTFEEEFLVDLSAWFNQNNHWSIANGQVSKPYDTVTYQLSTLASLPAGGYIIEVNVSAIAGSMRFNCNGDVDYFDTTGTHFFSRTVTGSANIGFLANGLSSVSIDYVKIYNVQYVDDILITNWNSSMHNTASSSYGFQPALFNLDENRRLINKRTFDIPIGSKLDAQTSLWTTQNLSLNNINMQLENNGEEPTYLEIESANRITLFSETL